VITADEAVALPPVPVTLTEYCTEPVSDVGVTDTVPLRTTDPVQLPSVEFAMTCVAFVVAIVHDTLFPNVTLVGVHVSDAVGAGALTVTV